jgi:hypothetical protein
MAIYGYDLMRYSGAAVSGFEGLIWSRNAELHEKVAAEGEPGDI